MNAHRPGTPLDPIVDRYLQWKRALGRGYLGVERVLVSLLQFMHERGAADLDQTLFDEWSKSFSELTANVRRNRQRRCAIFASIGNAPSRTALCRTLIASRGRARTARR